MRYMYVSSKFVLQNITVIIWITVMSIEAFNKWKVTFELMCVHNNNNNNGLGAIIIYKV